MAIVRDLAYQVVAMEERVFITSSTGATVFASTANTVVSGVAANGRVIDRSTRSSSPDVPAGTLYSVAMIGGLWNSTRGSTEADRKMTLAIKLQHGDSSGGGDMADYSTQFQQDDRVFFTTVQTTDLNNWSTAPFIGTTNPTYYDLRAAKRYIRTVLTGTKNRGTTESSGDEQSRVSATITFLGGDFVKDPPRYTGAGSTSTST